MCVGKNVMQTAAGGLMATKVGRRAAMGGLIGEAMRRTKKRDPMAQPGSLNTSPMGGP